MKVLIENYEDNGVGNVEVNLPENIRKDLESLMKNIAKMYSEKSGNPECWTGGYVEVDFTKRNPFSFSFYPKEEPEFSDDIGTFYADYSVVDSRYFDDFKLKLISS